MVKYLKHIFKIFLVTFLLVTNNTYAQSLNNNELGFYQVKNFTTKDYLALPQNWGVVQDNRGVIYVSNGDGVLEFDGTSWRKISLKNGLTVRSLAIDKKGRVYVGAYNDLGYLLPNNDGNLQYISLLNRLSKEDYEFGDIWKIFVLIDRVVFQSSHKIFILKNDSISVIESDLEFRNSFFVNNELFIAQQEKGLLRYKNDSLILLKGSKQIIESQLFILLPYKHNVMLGITNKKGVHLINYFSDKNEVKVIKKLTEADDLLKKNQVYQGVKISDNLLSIGTFEGIEIINKNGNLVYWLNKNMGLNDDNVKFQFVDRNNDLWISLSNGLSHVKINSPISVFDSRSELNGGIESITRFNNKIHVATFVGVYSLSDIKAVKHQVSKFNRLKDISATETWIVKSFNLNNDKFALIEQNNHIYEVNTNNDTAVVVSDIPWYIYQSEINNSIFYFGVEDGVLIKQKESKKWINKGKIDGVEKRITDIIEFNDNLWLSAGEDGIYRIDDVIPVMNSKVNFYDDSLLSKGPYIFQKFQNQLLIGTGKGIFAFNKETGKLIPQDNLNNLLGDEYRYIHRMTVDLSGKLWLVNYISDEYQEVGFFDYNQDSTLFWNPTPFLGDIKGQINAIYHDNDGVTWLGGSEGLFRYDSKVEKNYKQDFHCLIRKVRLGEDSTLFYGTYFDDKDFVSNIQSKALKPQLKYKHNSLIFNFSAMNIDVGYPTKYSYYLEGYDKKWSEWSEETKKEYTNLPENEYIFKVKAKNIYNHESDIATYEFVIFPPWYRTWWAYMLFVIVAVFVVYSIVKQYTKYLRAVIKENIAEISEQKDEIEKQHHEITASIKYAERIQKAIVPTYERAQELLPEHFVLWRPRDIVSGDFWWMTEKKGLVAIVAADSTGHGVPGAFVSMLGVSFLNEIVGRMDDLQADEILNQLRLHVKTTMKQTGKEGESKDGMDLALIILDIENSRIQYAGAYNPLFLIRDGELIETKANRNPIGIYIKEVDFTNHIIDVQKGDTLYIFSDGFVDQFGGERGRKFKTKNFKELLIIIQDKSMLEQELILDKTIDDWKGDLEQVDDIIIVGIRI